MQTTVLETTPQQHQKKKSHNNNLENILYFCLCSFFSAWCVLESNFVINLQQSKIVTSQAVTSHMNSFTMHDTVCTRYLIPFQDVSSFTMHDILFHSRTYHLHENILIPSNHVPADNNYAKCEKQSVKGQALQLIAVHMLMLMLQI